jgi:hypothetical protein
MTTVARVRKGALALPEVEEGPHFGAVAFTVRGKGFASLSKDGTLVQLRLPADQVHAAVADHPGAEIIARAGSPIGVALAVADLDVRDLDRLLRQAWEAMAPKRLVADHAPPATEAPAPDLPAIGRPATRALALAGITTLDAVARHSEAELLDLHGVGPRAIRILQEALAAEGLSFRRG